MNTYGFEVDELIGLSDFPGVLVPPASAADGAGFADALLVLQFFGCHAADGLQLGDAATPTIIHGLRETLSIGDSAKGVLDLLASLGDTVTFGDVAAIAYKVLVAETIGLAGNQTAWRAVLLDLADALALTSGVGSTLNANVALASALAFGDSLARSVTGTLADGVMLGAAQTASLRAMLKLLDTMRVADSLPSPSVTFTALVDERLALGADLTAAQAAHALIADGVQFLATLALDDGVYLAWVMNAESHAFTGYSNYPFNSFATINGKTYGAKADGIYLLEGDDDAGAAIDAFVRGGLSDFGSSKFKRMPSMYLGYTTDGRMLMKVTVVDDDGVREEHWYGLEDRPAGALREGRVKLGRGLKSTYWGFELANVDGADFALDSISWYPVVLDRRL